MRQRSERGPELTVVCELGMHEKCRAYAAFDWLPKPPPWPQRCPCECHRPATEATPCESGAPVSPLPYSGAGETRV